MPEHVDQAVLADAKQRFPLASLIGKEVALKRKGAEWTGCCPFHKEKTPSFYVYDDGHMHCLAGETVVPTRHGYRQIRDLAGATAPLLMPDGSWQEVPVRSFGVQPLYRIELTRNGVRRVEFATGGHGWFVRGVNDRRQTVDLKVGDRLEAVTPQKRSDWGLDRTGVQHGMVFGDGTVQCRRGFVRLWGEKMDLAPVWFDEFKPQTKDRDGVPYVHVYGGRRFETFKDLPSLDLPSSYLLGFLAGWIATDGHVAERDGQVVLTSSRRDALEWLREACVRLDLDVGTIGVQMRQGYLDAPGPHYRVYFRSDTFDVEMLLKRTAAYRFLKPRAIPDFHRLRWVVQSVELTDRVEEVFCAQVPGFHAFALADNLLTANCFGCGAHGDHISWLMQRRGWSFREAADWLIGRHASGAARLLYRYQQAGQAFQEDGNRSIAQKERARIAQARVIVGECAPIKKTLAERYLLQRKISIPLPGSLLFHPGTFHRESGRTLPALVAVMRDSKGLVCAVQRTWLDPATGRKADVKPVKKTKGAMLDGAVHLGEPGRILGIAEGTETGLSAKQRYCLPVWVSLGTSQMPNIKLPPCVEEVVLFRDNSEGKEGDAPPHSTSFQRLLHARGPGFAWALRAAEAFEAQGRTVLIEPPPAGYSDWNSVDQEERRP